MPKKFPKKTRGKDICSGHDSIPSQTAGFTAQAERIDGDAYLQEYVGMHTDGEMKAEDDVLVRETGADNKLLAVVTILSTKGDTSKLISQ